jgi:hypothetical protein
MTQRFLRLNVDRKRSPAWRRVGAKFVEVFGADLRSLATFRIVLALLVLADLANRATDLAAYYTDWGILPRVAAIQDARLLSPYSFSLNLMNGMSPFQALLFGVAALAALAMLAGYRTRLATIVVWVLVLSIHHRNMLVINAGDILLDLLLFWSIFLPLGAVWSVDRARQATRGRLSMRFFSAATAALFLQIALMYWFTALIKTGRDWRVDGTALYYTFSNDQVTTQIGSYLLHFPTLLTVLTFATLAFEALGPFLLFSPIFNGPLRTVMVLAFMGLHFGIWVTMEVGLFPWISALSMVCFLPGWFWERVFPRLRAALPGQEGVARRLQRAPHAAARLVRTHLSPLWARLSAPMGVGRSSVMGLAAHGDRPARGAPGGGAFAALADGPGDAVAEGGRRDAAGSQPVILRSSLATNLLALFFLFYIFCWNITTVSSFSLPTPAYPLGPFLGLYQDWVMFAPNPPKDDGWWVVPGELQGGRQVDLLSVVQGDYDLREVSYEKPENILATYKNEHWHKYLEFITTLEDVTTPEERAERIEDQRQQRENFASYLCRAWNERHAGDESLEDLQIIYIREKSLPDYQRPEPERVLLYKHSCQ